MKIDAKISKLGRHIAGLVVTAGSLAACTAAAPPGPVVRTGQRPRRFIDGDLPGRLRDHLSQWHDRTPAPTALRQARRLPIRRYRGQAPCARQHQNALVQGAGLWRYRNDARLSGGRSDDGPRRSSGWPRLFEIRRGRPAQQASRTSLTVVLAVRPRKSRRDHCCAQTRRENMS